MQELKKESKNIWATNSDVCGLRVIYNKNVGKYEVYSFDECFKSDYLEEIDSNLLYLQEKYKFKLGV